MKLPLLLFSVLFSSSLAQSCDPLSAEVHEWTSAPDGRGRALHFSWRVLPNATFSWTKGRKYCKSKCMDLVAIDSDSMWRLVRSKFQQEPSLKFIWTGGRKCNYRGCDRPELQPALRNGWFWAATNARLPDTLNRDGSCSFCAWSAAGALGGPQPDNREQAEKGRDEACLAVLNNLYGDGLQWHDVACHHVKPVICQRQF